MTLIPPSDYIPSFSAQILLHKNFLDTVCTPNCNTKNINQNGLSLVDTLFTLTPTVFNPDTIDQHWMTTLFKGAFRTVSIASAALGAASFGIVYLGSLTTKHFWNVKKEANVTTKDPEKKTTTHNFQMAKSNESANDTAWQLTKQRVQTFFQRVQGFFKDMESVVFDYIAAGIDFTGTLFKGQVTGH